MKVFKDGVSFNMKLILADGRRGISSICAEVSDSVRRVAQCTGRGDSRLPCGDDGRV